MKPRLTRDQVLEIRRVFSNSGFGGAGSATLAARFGVSQTTIYKALNGTHVAAAGLPDLVKAESPRRAFQCGFSRKVDLP